MERALVFVERAFVFPILEHPTTWLIARILVTFMYWFAGLGFLIDFPGAVQAMVASGVTVQPMLIAALTIAVQLIGSGLVIHGRWAWFGAGMLSIFTLLTVPMVHHWWTMTGAARIQARLESQEHLSVIGGLIAVSILSHMAGKLRAAHEASA